jgi:hypothetical protein
MCTKYGDHLVIMCKMFTFLPMIGVIFPFLDPKPVVLQNVDKAYCASMLNKDSEIEGPPGI